MKAAGVIRRIDDLGRVVVPRDMRKSMGYRKVLHWKYVPLRRGSFLRNTIRGLLLWTS